jgi:hypothetical protein
VRHGALGLTAGRLGRYGSHGRPVINPDSTWFGRRRIHDALGHPPMRASRQLVLSGCPLPDAPPPLPFEHDGTEQKGAADSREKGRH